MAILTGDVSERIYNENEWAVQRWDALNGGRKIAPKSFCQFWRAVFLWCTLMQLPLVGKWFIKKEQAVAEAYAHSWDEVETDSAAKQPPLIVRAIVGGLSLIWSGLRWSIFLPLRGAWWLLSVVIEFFSDRPAIGAFLKRWLQVGADILAMAVIVGVVMVGIGVLAYGIYLSLSQPVELWAIGLLVIAGFSGLCWYVATSRLAILYVLDKVGAAIWSVLAEVGHGIAAVARGIAGLAHLIKDIALTNKKHICPPMRIKR